MDVKEKLIEILKTKYDHFCDQCSINKDSKYIENLASHLISNGVTVARHGRWIEYQIPPIICCSNCDWATDVKEKNFNYCPNCGAKMDGGDGNGAMA